MEAEEKNNIKESKWIEFLGFGSFGLVFKAIMQTDSLDNNIRAIKVIIGDDKDTRIKSAKEVNIIINVEHENIVKIFGIKQESLSEKERKEITDLLPVGEDFDIYRIAFKKNYVKFNLIEMELCGISLKQWLKDVCNKKTVCSDGARLNICQQIKNGVKFLHSKRIIHRDLKPGNICFSSSNIHLVKICDFGESRLPNSDLSSMTNDAGTAFYRAPEIQKGKYNRTVDIFSVGIIFFEIFQKHLQKNWPQSVRDLRAGKGKEVVLCNSNIPELKTTILDYTSKETERRSIFYFKRIEYVLAVHQWFQIKDIFPDLNLILELGQIPINFMDVFHNNLKQENLKLLFSKQALEPFKIIKSWKVNDIENLMKILKIVSLQKVINIKKPWSVEVGTEIPITQYTDFVQVKSLKSLPYKSENESKHLFQDLLPYIFEKIKMSELTCTQAKFLYEYKTNIDVKYFENSDNDDDNTIEQISFSRLDMLVTLFSIVDDLLAIDITRILGQFSVTLPLVIPCIEKNSSNTHIVTLPWLENIIVKRGTPSGQILEGRLFKSPFKLILAVRHKTKTNTNVGKSAILNGLFKTDFMFSSYLEPGARLGRPYSHQGCVEIAWLATENCKPVLWELINKDLHGTITNNNIKLLKSEDNKEEHYIIANLHGDANQNHEIINTLRPIINAFLVFHFTESKIHAYVQVLKNEGQPIAEFDFKKQDVNNLSRIELNASDSYVHEKISKKICEAFQIGNLITNFNPFALKCGNNLRLVNGIFNKSSQILINYILKKSISKFKEQLFLQTLPLLEINKNLAEICENKSIQFFIKSIREILLLPLEERKIAIFHLEQQVSSESGQGSKKVRLELLKLKQKRSQEFKSLPTQDRKLSPKIKSLESKIKKKEQELEFNNLGLEHLLRELGKIYAIGLHNIDSVLFTKMQFPLMIKRLAELVVEGQVIEIIDGDLGEISGVWLNSILGEVSSILGDFRLFVISILGLQSSGKSTLLNSLFGCKFSVSSGRCTRGLFMRLLFLDPQLKNNIKYDGIILIDTEGMCAPEKMMDKKADIRDREMATYAMLISNLTIVNIMGETMKEMTDILQIVVVTMARLEKIEVTADVLLVQHCSEVDNSKFQNATKEFCNALREAIDVTNNQFTALGIINSACLKKLVERVENHQLLQLFHSYKSGSTANAAPSIDYHNDCALFYQSILDVMRDASLRWSFNTWYDLLQRYWAALQKQDFALKFKNIQEIHEFIDRGNRIAEVILSIEEAITFHRREVKKKVREIILINEYNNDLLRPKLCDKIDISIKETIENCKWRNFNEDTSNSSTSNDTELYTFCTCLVAYQNINNINKHVRASISVLDDVDKTIKSYLDKARKTTCNLLKKQLDFQLVQNQRLNQMDERITLFVKNLPIPFNQHQKATQYILNMQFWTKYNQDQNSYSTVDVKNEILTDILKAYKETPLKDYAPRIVSNSSQTDLGKLKGIIGKFLNNKLSLIQVSVIKKAISEKLSNLLVNRESYQANDCYIAQQFVSEIIKDLTEEWKLNQGFSDEFKWEIHLYSTQLFLEMYEEVIVKNSHNSGQETLNLLLRKKNYIRMSLGFTYKGEGTVIAEYILHAALQKAKKSAEGFAKKELLKKSWVKNVENVRLSFFDSLVEDIKSNKIDSAITYFQKPEETITKWFSNKVDNNTKKSILHDKAAKEYNRQIEDLWKDLNEFQNRPNRDIKEFRNIFLKYLSEVDGIHYVSNFYIKKPNSAESKEFCDALFQRMKDKAQFQFSILSFKKLSESKSVKAKLGCTKFCYWCGALCWGHAEHFLNEDVTRKHHTCHQPQGLIGIVNENTQTIVAETCETLAAKELDYDFRKLKKPGQPSLTWKQIKLSPEFEDWIFINQDDFTNLMAWFFVKLNYNIAELYSVKPSETEELKRLGYSESESKITEMFSSIKQQLQ